MTDRVADVPEQPDQPFTLNDRTAWVVGAGRPLGRAIANALAEAGADVALTGLGIDEAERFQVASAANQVWSSGRRNLALDLDPADPENLGRVRSADRRRVGPTRHSRQRPGPRVCRALRRNQPA